MTLSRCCKFRCWSYGVTPSSLAAFLSEVLLASQGLAFDTARLSEKLAFIYLISNPQPWKLYVFQHYLLSNASLSVMWRRAVWYKFTHLSEDFVCFWSDILKWVRASTFMRFINHTRWRITVGRNLLGEWSARRRDFYPITHNTHNRQTSIRPGGIRTHNLSRWAAADLSLRLCGPWERLRRFYWK